MNTKKIILLLLPILFLAQACNFFTDLSGTSGSGSRGIFFSTDSGQTWGELNQVGNNKTQLESEQVSRIVIDETNSKNMLAVTSTAGIFASNSGGNKWVQILPNFAGYDAFINPVDNRQVFAAGSRNNVSVILKSPDSGGTWTQIYTEPTGRAAVVTMIYDPRTPTTFYAGLSSGPLLKSTDAGVSWNTLTDFQDRLVKVAVTADGKIFYALTRAKGLWRSVDGGRTWTVSAVPGTPSQYNDFTMERGNSAALLVGTAIGLFRTTDSGGTWTKMLLPATPQVNNVSSVVVNPQNRRQIFAAIRSTVYRSDDDGINWRTEGLPTNRTISEIAIDAGQPNRIYVGLK